MTPATIIRDAQAEGVKVTLSPSGTIKAIGEGVAVNRWLTALRDYKTEIATMLKAGGQTAANDPEQAGPDLPLLAAIVEYHALIDRLTCSEEERRGYHALANQRSAEHILSDLPALRVVVDRQRGAQFP